jgi:hypothetical protein
MQPILTIEFTCGEGENKFTEETVTLHSPEEFFQYVGPGGGCEDIPDNVEEIRMLFTPPAHKNVQNHVADLMVTLQLGMVHLTGPLSEIIQTAEEIVDKAGRGELSESFAYAIGAQS